MCYWFASTITLPQTEGLEYCSENVRIHFVKLVFTFCSETHCVNPTDIYTGLVCSAQLGKRHHSFHWKCFRHYLHWKPPLFPQVDGKKDRQTDGCIDGVMFSSSVPMPLIWIKSAEGRCCWNAPSMPLLLVVPVAVSMNNPWSCTRSQNSRTWNFPCYFTWLCFQYCHWHCHRYRRHRWWLWWWWCSGGFCVLRTVFTWDETNSSPFLSEDYSLTCPLNWQVM